MWLLPGIGLNNRVGGDEDRDLICHRQLHPVPIQVMDLEARLDQAQEDLKSGMRPGRERGAGTERILPRAPAKGVLAGHRNPVTCVALHPLYSVVASSSEDATVKVREGDRANICVCVPRRQNFVRPHGR